MTSLRAWKIQLEVLEHPLDRSLFVAGPPGSGKTVLALQRAQMIAEMQEPVPIVTYNRMLRRLLALMQDVDLFLVHGPEPLSRQAAQSLPGPDVLERP